MVTLKTIAEIAGVSPATVSQILNGKYKENRPSMRAKAEKIRRIARELGYRPHAGARAVATHRFDTICLLQDWHHYRSHLPASMLQAILEELAEAGKKLILDRWPVENLHSKEELPHLFRELCADGMLINIHSEIPEDFRQSVAELNRPVVWINAPVPGDVVMPDDVDAGYRLTMQLIRCGYRRILFLDHLYHMQPRHHSRELRLHGYRQAMMDAGLKPMFFTLTPEQLDLDRCACEQAWLEKHPEGLDAIISYDYGQLTILWHNGGFAGTIRDFAWGTFADHPQPPLPGYIMVIPWETIGREAASLLLHRLDGKQEAAIPSSPQQRKIPCRLYHRARQLPS